jgi:regulator of sirC expression with transglutaminase-like and TPR domain
MSSQHPLDTESARDYAAAYATHYTRRDLLRALQAYDQVIELCPTAPEAEYSRSQMRNIVKLVVPARELLASQVELVRRHLQRVDNPSAAAVSP